MKIVYNIIKSLRPHFFSLREIKENVSLDIKLPTNWRYENMHVKGVKENVPFEIKIQDEKPSNRLISLISSATSEGYELVFNYAKLVIQTNKEEEEKERLFNEKVQELKTLFLSSSLDKLKDIKFNELKNELSTNESEGEIRLGSGEGSGTNGEGEEKTD